MAKEYRVMFRADETLLKRIEKLGSKLGLGRGEVLRLCINKMFEKYLDTEEEILLLDNKEWNAMVQTKLERFLGEISQFTKDIKTVSSQVKKTGNVQSGDSIEVTEADLAKWVDLAIKDDRNFNTEDVSPEAEKAKTMILRIIQKMKGRVN